MKTKGQFHKLLFVGLASSALVICSVAAHAQVQQQTGVADPSRAGEEFKQPDMTPQVEPQVSVKQAAPVNAGWCRQSKIYGQGNRPDGATVYNDAQLKSVYADQIGQTVSLADVYGIANKLTKKYRNDGYILTQVVVPPQEIDGGVAKLRVVEGYVDNITVSPAPTRTRRSTWIMYAPMPARWPMAARSMPAASSVNCCSSTTFRV